MLPLPRISFLVLAAALGLLQGEPDPSAESLSQTVSRMDSTAGLVLQQGVGNAVPEGPDGRMVTRFDGPFQARVDLKALGIEPRAFDLIKVEVRADRGAFLRFSLENYPEPGELSHWYVLDNSRGAFGWRTIWIDLTAPEEIKSAGEYKGMASKDTDVRGLRFDGHVSDLKRGMQGDARSTWIGHVRFARKAVDLDWDQAQSPWTREADGTLVFSYPLTVTNRLGRPMTALISLLPFAWTYAQGRLSQDRVDLKPNEVRTVEAKIVLPGSVASQKEPLYVEAFEARAMAEGVPDSEVTILRSADPIHLTVTVPIPEERLRLPLQPRPKDLPAFVTSFEGETVELAKKIVAQADPAKLRAAVAEKGIDQVSEYTQAVASAAFLYDSTGDGKYLAKARELLMFLPDLWKEKHEEWKRKPVRRISAGIVTGNTLGFGFRVGGTQRPPYLYGSDGNSRGGSMHGVMNGFDIVSGGLGEADRQRLISEFLLPAGIQCRNHYIGLGNQQSTVNYVTLYAGLAARNWPLVSFACSSEHGVRSNITWAFDDDGLCIEGHYQSYTINPILWTLELLYGRGVDLYDRRFSSIVHSRGAEAIGMAYPYPITKFLDEQRFAGKPFLKDLAGEKTDGYHLTASTLLRWKGLDVSMNWATHIFRSSRDRCALWIRSKDPALAALAAGGGSYNHSSFGQSIIIIDEGLQNPVPAEILSVDVLGPVQHVMSRSARHFPGSTITRTFALLGRHVLVVDRVENDGHRKRTVDWWLKAAGSRLSVAVEERQGSWTSKSDDASAGVVYGAGVKNHQFAKTDGTWSEGNGRLTMLGEPGTEVIVTKDREPMLLARRRDVPRTDFVACFSLEMQALDRVEVKKGDGAPANAVGVKITLKGGTVIHALVNEEPGTEVVCGPLRTKERFATDYAEPAPTE